MASGDQDVHREHPVPCRARKKWERRNRNSFYYWKAREIQASQYRIPLSFFTRFAYPIHLLFCGRQNRTLCSIKVFTVNILAGNYGRKKAENQ